MAIVHVVPGEALLHEERQTEGQEGSALHISKTIKIKNGI